MLSCLALLGFLQELTFFNANLRAFERYFGLVNKEDLEKVLRSEIFVNKADNQVGATYEILGYDPIQKSFLTPKYVIRAKDPRLHNITIVEHGFLIYEGSPIPEGVPLVGTSSSAQVAEAEGGELEEEEVADLGPSEDEFGVFD